MTLEELIKNNSNYTWASDPITLKHLREVKEELAIKVVPVLNHLEDKGWKPRVVQGTRSVDEERKHVADGSSKTMHSMHLIGKAVDIVDKRYGWDGKASNLNYQYWKDYGSIIHSLYPRGEIQWGGDWIHFKDVAHIQLPHSPGEFDDIDFGD